MKVIIGNDPDNTRDLKVHTRSSTTGADGPDRVLQPGDYAEIEILDGDYLVGNPDAFREHTPSVDTGNVEAQPAVIIGGPTADAEAEAAEKEEPEVVQPDPAEPGSFLKTSEELAAEGSIETVASTVGDDTINGGNGNDSLISGVGDDTFLGGQGDTWTGNIGTNDTLAGGQGADTFSGGQGADTFTGDAATETAPAPSAATAGGGEPGADAVTPAQELRDPTTEELQAVVADLLDDDTEVELTAQGLISVDHLNVKLAEKGFAPVTAAQRTEAQAAVKG